jgi:hypothetical protein
VSLGHTIFYVKDFGIGVEARHYEQIFRMFKRLHGRDEYGGGVGAGLTIVQKLVQRHGGCVWLDSVVDVGTTFYFTLPCGDDEARNVFEPEALAESFVTNESASASGSTDGTSGSESGSSVFAGRGDEVAR